MAIPDRLARPELLVRLEHKEQPEQLETLDTRAYKEILDCLENVVRPGIQEQLVPKDHKGILDRRVLVEL